MFIHWGLYAIFQAWGSVGQPEEYCLIIDCLMNLLLLYWASLETENEIYRERAGEHTKTALEVLIREDASTFPPISLTP